MLLYLRSWIDRKGREEEINVIGFIKIFNSVQS